MFFVGALAIGSTVVGCGGGSDAVSSSSARLDVSAAFYPVEEAARAVGGDRVSVYDLTPPGGEPHDIELTPAAVSKIEGSDLVLYLGNGFQPAVEKAVANLGEGPRSVDLLTGVKLRTNDRAVPGVVGNVDQGELADRRDPHVWVDPKTFATMVAKVRDGLIDADPDGRSTYTSNANAYLSKLGTLDREFSTALKECRGKALVTSHAAFGYLADRYGLIQAPIAGLSPDEEPDPKSIAATARFAKQNGVRTVFFETLVPKRLAQTVADEIGAGTDALDPVEGIPQARLDAGATYISIQRENLRRLVKGLACTKG